MQTMQEKTKSESVRLLDLMRAEMNKVRPYLCDDDACAFFALTLSALQKVVELQGDDEFILAASDNTIADETTMSDREARAKNRRLAESDDDFRWVRKPL